MKNERTSEGLTVYQAVAQECQPDVIDLSGEWFFRMSGGWHSGPLSETIVLPGSMDENGKGVDNSQEVTSQHLNRDFLYTGPAVYQRSVTIPPHWLGRTIWLSLERTKKTRVWIDGELTAPQQKSYTTPHKYNLTTFCLPGEHTLTIEVDNSPDGMPHAMYSTLLEGEAWCHQVAEQTQTNWNGILGKIVLSADPAVTASALRLRPDVRSSSVRVTAVLHRTSIAEELSGTAVFHAESWNTGGDVHKTEQQTITFHFSPGTEKVSLDFSHPMGPSPLLWDEFHPTLYRMTTTLFYTDHGSVCRTDRTDDFGMRTFTAGINGGGKQFFINGRPTLLRGEINCAVFPKTGYAPMDLPNWLHVFETYKAYGLNHVRFHTWVPPKAAFQAADQLGLYLYIELPQWGRRMFGDVAQGDFSDADYYKEDTQQIFAEYLNSPSFVMFALGNEERIGLPYYEEFLQFCKAVEPELLVSDIAGHSTYPPSADFASKFLDPGYLPQIYPGNDWDYSEAVKTAPIPITGHEVGQLQVYPDYGFELSTYDDAVLKPRNLIHFQEILTQTGSSHMAAKFHHSTAALAAMLYRYFTESYLRTNGAGGFLLLGLQDFPGQGTALVGLLDSFLNGKGAVSPEVFRRSCCELPVLARMERFVWSAGETFSAQVLVPNYAEQDITADITWQLNDLHGHTVSSGSFTDLTLSLGKVSCCGQVETTLPVDLTAQRLVLRLALRTDTCLPYAPKINDYSLWVFPTAHETIPSGDVLVCRAFTLEARQALEHGRSVLIISEGTSAALPQSRAVSFRPDFWSPMFHTKQPDGYSLGMYINSDHPLFADFPTDDYASWQWYETLQGARGILINQFPQELQPIAQPIATIDLPERLALLFEARVGPGRLCVCTVDLLQKTDIASKYLLAALYRYICSDKFAPTTTVSAEILETCLPPLDLLAVQLSGKHDFSIGEKADLCLNIFDSKGICAVPQDAEITYRSSDESVLSVSHAGQIQAYRPGIAQISACVSNGHFRRSDSYIASVGRPQIKPIPFTGALITASSSAEGCSASQLLQSNGGSWQSDYRNRTLRMPQWVVLELPQQTTISAVLCKSRQDNTRGTILRASISTSLDGIDYHTACCRSWPESAVKEPRLFSFASRSVRYIRIDIEWAVMYTGDSNAASIAKLYLYNGEIIAEVERFSVKTVRFGTTLSEALSQMDLPSHIRIMLPDGSHDTASVIWHCDEYCSDIPGSYRILGTIFHERYPNPGELCAEQILQVRPKDLTSPPDKSRFLIVLAQVQEFYQQTLSPATHAALALILDQAKNFNALTGAVQHDVDVWTDRLSDAMKV